MLDNKICVVVGGAKGSGLQVVYRYANEGYEIAFMDVDKKSGMDLKSKLESEYGSKVFFFHGDARSEEDLELFAGAIIGQYGTVNCIFYHGKIFDQEYDFSCLLKNHIVAGGKVKCFS